MYVSPQSDRLPHEPLRVRWSTIPFAARIVCKAAFVVVLAVLTAGLWPIFLLGVLKWGWPPNTTRMWQFRRYFRLVRTAAPPEPGIAPLSRMYLTLELLHRFVRLPLPGLAWCLDELLYGRELARVQVRAPLFLLSAARSGSTQLSRYLEADSRLAAPTVLQTIVPYLWVWRLIAPTLGRIISRRRVESLFESMATEEFVQRHELSPFDTDTFEVLFSSMHLNALAFCLGPEVLSQDVAFSCRAPHNRQLWEADFVEFLDRVGRKTLLYAGPKDDGELCRLYVKGHFQAADDALARRYPDAHFVTVVREPASRLQSMLNHVHGHPAFEQLGAVPWAWLAASLPADEVAYCLREQDWFCRAEGPRRTVIRFADYIVDLEGTMTQLYRACMGDETLPDHVPTEHTPRERKKYRVNRSIEELGIDIDAFEVSLADYRAWCLQPGEAASGKEVRAAATLATVRGRAR